MTSDGVFGRTRGEAPSPARGTRGAARSAVLGLLLTTVALGSARAAEPSYPFEGTWVRANRVCAANAPRVRTYTAHDVTFPTGHCTFRKVAAGGGQLEIFEDCRKAEHPGNYTETIRMLGPDAMLMRRQAARLKIARPLRFTRCSAAAPGPAGAAPKGAAAPPHHASEPASRPPEDRAAKPVDARPVDSRPAEAKPPEPKP